ncbi:undecaprenyl-phosphate glucose phosphotransferase [candidate division LCP-89 bacterium B3_LCP]|uniref:Undecaprenyl-phosphate glucose phosphotransferase n=1 Tax=candidate division LCP-89 bacterium B3_LCP TaxID=2012998 RepID=A0A532V3M2_UNCL8|nr:MAG: undecaprenyl-phosphate glucose phosphotransferase [candidate division LCP-89 bacterium B3_LCP]
MNRQLTGAKAEVIFPFLAVLLDAAAIISSFGISYWMRFYSPLTMIFPVTRGIPELGQYWTFSFVAMVIFCSVFALRGLYRLHDRISTIEEFVRVLQGTLLTMPWLFAVAFLYRDFSYSRLVFLLIIITSIIILTAERALIKSFQRKLYRRGVGVLKAAVCGGGELAKEINERLVGNPHLGYRSIGFIKVSGSGEGLNPVVGSISEIDEIVRRENLDMIFIALDHEDHHRLKDVIRQCEGINLDFLLAPDQIILEGNVQPCHVAGVPLLKIKESPLFGWKGIVKRAFDLFVSSLALISFSPLMLIIALLVKLGSKGPVFYKQERVGLDGREFNISKFRTMKPQAESKTGPVWAKKEDVRTTGVGKFLRKYSLDELPQLFNVFKGNMSIVGPRPERPHFVKEFRQSVPHYLERHRVRSGMTGWAQVNGLRGDTSIEQRTRYDIYYVENWSLAFDLRIIIMTVKEVISGENAY